MARGKLLQSALSKVKNYLTQFAAQAASNPSLNRAAQGFSQGVQRVSQTPAREFFLPTSTSFRQKAPAIREAGIRTQEFADKIRTTPSGRPNLFREQFARPVQFLGYSLEDLGTGAELLSSPKQFFQSRPTISKESFFDPRKPSVASSALGLIGLGADAADLGRLGVRQVGKVNRLAAVNLDEISNVNNLKRQWDLSKIEIGRADPTKQIIEEWQGIFKKKNYPKTKGYSKGKLRDNVLPDIETMLQDLTRYASDKLLAAKRGVLKLGIAQEPKVAQQPLQDVPKPIKSVVEEAKKYKSAEEFVDAITPKKHLTDLAREIDQRLGKVTKTNTEAEFIAFLKKNAPKEYADIVAKEKKFTEVVDSLDKLVREANPDVPFRTVFKNDPTLPDRLRAVYKQYVPTQRPLSVQPKGVGGVQPSSKGVRPKEMGNALYIDARGTPIDVESHQFDIYGTPDLRVVTTPNELNIETKSGFLPEQIATLKRMFEKIKTNNPNAKIVADTPTGSGTFKSIDELISQPSSKGVTELEKAGIKTKLPEVSQAKGIPLKQFSPLKAATEAVPAPKAPTTPLQKVSQVQSKVPGTKALPEIISREPIKVGEKVGILDYLRTPDRVLKKIGLEKEATHLRGQYEKYVKELPQEIDKITQWSKQVSPDSNVRIFKYLDGQDVALSKNELKVANEIKGYLKGWAEKLGLPEDKRITNYITHIFEKDFIQKEFDPDMAKLIKDRVPGSVYDPFVEQRLGKMGYIEDTWRALDAYVKRATRKVNLDPALKQIKEVSKTLEDSQLDYVKKYTAGINMRPTWVDSAFDNTFKQIFGYRAGQRPTNLLTRTARQAVFRGTLGLNVGTALRNLTQGVNTYAKLGEKYIVKGYWDLLAKGSDELKQVGVLADNLIQDRNLNVKRQFVQKLDKVLFYFFDTAEKINRGSAYYGAKARALGKGLSEAEAIEAGKKMVRDTQFTFGSIDTPVALQSDIVKMMAQFQTFTLKQAEFLGEMAKNKEYAGLVRYTLGSIAMLYSIGELIGLEPKDMIPSFRIGIPPTLQTPVEIGKAIAGAPDDYGNVPTTEERLSNIGESLIPYIPGGVQVKKTIQGLTDVSQGYSESASGRLRYPVAQGVGQTIRGGLFGRHNLPEAQEYYDKDRSVLGEKQTEYVKQAQDRFSAYQNIINEREQNAILEQAKKKLEAGKGGIDTQGATPETLKEFQKLEFKYSNEPYLVQGETLLYKDEEGSVKELNINFEPKFPKLTGADLLDEELIADYKGEITKAKNAVMKAFDLGYLNQDQTFKELEKLKIKQDQLKKPKKPKKPNIKFVPLKFGKRRKKLSTKSGKKGVKLVRPKKIKAKF